MEDNGFELMRFDLPKEASSIIKVIGVGGGGSNAVNYMYKQGIKGVDFIVCNTDSQALDNSPVPIKVQLGATLTEGKGAGSIPEVGKNAAVETLDEIKEILGASTTMVFVTAGMGGGTGTGAAPIIARAARELGILTVGIVTIPFMFEGRKRMVQADEGLKEMRDSVDTLLVITNDKLRELYGNLTLNQAFSHADEVLCTAAKGIAEVITLTGEINVDMNDVNTVMRNSGVAIMGSGMASGDGRAMKAVGTALESPLLNDNDITGANFVLLNITYGQDEVLMDEIMEITDHIQEKAGMSAEVIWGYGPDETLGEDLCVTVIATGFSANEVDAGLPREEPKKEIYILGQDELKEVTQKVERPTQVRTEEPETGPVEIEVEEEAEPFLKTEAPVEAVDTPVQEDQLNFEIEENLAEHTPAAEPELFTGESEPEDVDRLKLEEQENVAQEQVETPKYYDLNSDSLHSAEALPVDSLKFDDQVNEDLADERPSREELMSKNKERESRIKELTFKLKTPSGLADLEDEPAYKRRNVTLDNVPHSSESQASRYTLSEEEGEEGEKKAKLKDNNSFLHDNVD